MSVQPYQRYNRGVGYVDPNTELRPGDLYGTSPSHLGVYYRMRIAHSLIRTHMDERRRQLARITYEVRPRQPDPSPAQQTAARMVGAVLTGMRHKPLSVLLSEIDDRVASFGHAACQLVSDGERLDVVWIEPYVVREWITADQRRRLVGVEYDTGAGWQKLRGDSLVWFGAQSEEGNFWGAAELRGLLAIFAMYEQEVTSHIDQRQLEAGLLYTYETEAGVSARAVEKAMEYQGKVYEGQRAPFHLPHGMAANVLTVTSPAGAKTREMLSYYDTIVREYMGAMIGSLGINGVGARSLGETFEVADRERLLSHAENVCVMASGMTSSSTRLIRTVAEWLGIDQDDDPIIAVAERPSRASAERPAQFAALVGAGVYPLDRVTDEQRRALVEEDLGLPYPSGESEPASRDGVIDADGVAALHYPPADVSAIAAAGLAMRLDVPAEERGVRWRDDVATARRLADGDGFTLGELRTLLARINAIADASAGDAIRKAMLGGDDAAAWIHEVTA